MSLRRILPGLVAAALLLPTAAPARSATAGLQANSSPATVHGCIMAAASVYRVPPVLLVILLNVEGGVPGAVHPNANGTVDIGPMQINQIWLPSLARHFHAPERATYAAIKDNFCANVAAGAWILHRSIKDAGGDLWGGVADYHSRTPIYESAYLGAVLREVHRLQAMVKGGGDER